MYNDVLGNQSKLLISGKLFYCTPYFVYLELSNLLGVGHPVFLPKVYHEFLQVEVIRIILFNVYYTKKIMTKHK